MGASILLGRARAPERAQRASAHRGSWGRGASRHTLVKLLLHTQVSEKYLLMFISCFWVVIVYLCVWLFCFYFTQAFFLYVLLAKYLQNQVQVPG